MAYSKGHTQWPDDISQTELAYKYFGVDSYPHMINAPYREDNHPSVGLISDGQTVCFRDFATGDKGSIFKLLELSKIDYQQIIKDYKPSKRKKKVTVNTETSIQVRFRDWADCDKAYWGAFGISIDWLEFADVHPIDRVFFIKNNQSHCFGCAKLAYAYIEHKDNKVTYKIYQPLTKQRKWYGNIDASILSLWRQLPPSGNLVVICSSLKDALCLWAQSGIPCIAPQGEAYSISKTACNELKKRFKHVVICLDNDEPGKADALKMSKETGFPFKTLPEGYGKDISDIYKNDPTKFKERLMPLFLDYIW